MLAHEPFDVVGGATDRVGVEDAGEDGVALGFVLLEVVFQRHLFRSSYTVSNPT
jgi:hypothetical protein